MPVSGTTALPDVAQPTLDNGVEDEIGVSWADAIDKGWYQLQYRETSSSTWIDMGTLGEASTAETITGLEDGEEYEVRLRSGTEHIAGAWTSPVAIVTKFPGAGNLRVDTKSARSITLLWDDNADNEDGFRLERRELFHTGWGEWRVLEDLPPNTTSHTHAVHPETTYEYRVEAYTEDTQATTSPLEVTADDDGVRSDRVPAQGWHAVIEDSVGNQYEPTIVGSPTFQPTLNGLPTAEIAVANPDRWDQPEFEEAPLRVYLDGNRLPIDTFVTVDRSEAQATLQGRGGSELRRRVERSYQSQAVHTAGTDLVASETSYATDVDVPATETLTDQVLQTADTTTELTDRLLTSITSTTPLQVSSSQIATRQTSWTREAENFDAASGDTSFFKPEYSGNGVDDGDGRAIELESQGDYIEFTFTPQYDIPEDELVPWARIDTVPDQDTPELTVTINGNTTYPDASLGVTGIDWRDFKTDPSSSNVDPSPAVSAGEQVTVRYEVTGTSGSSAYHFDVVAPLDGRFSYTFDNSVETNASGNNYLDGPEHYPQQIDLIFEDAVTAYSVTAAQVNAVLSGTEAAQHLAVSNDLGATWTVVDNTDTLDTTFSERGGTVRLRVRLSRGGSQTQTPGQGIEGHALDSYELSADLDDVATLVNRTYDGTVDDLLSDFAEYGDLTWEVRYNDGFEVIITRPGLRSGSVDPDLVDYNVTKDSSRIVTKAVVYGKAQPVAGEAVTADHGTAVELAQDYLTETSEVVRDASSGTTYARGVDYRLDEQAGTITTLASGAITDGQSLEVDYQHRSRGVFEADSHDGSAGRELSRTIPAATTDRACQQAALKIVQTADEPRWTAEATIASGLTDVPLSSALDLDGLPTRGEALEVWDVEERPDGVSLQLGNRDSVSEVVNDIQSRLEAVARLS